MGVQQLVLLVLELCLVHGSAGVILSSPVASTPHEPALVPQAITVLIPSMPPSPPEVTRTDKLVPSTQNVPEVIAPTPQHMAYEKTPIAVPQAQVPVASPPIKITEIPPPVHPYKPGVVPTASPPRKAPEIPLPEPHLQVPVASPPRMVPEIPLPVPHAQVPVASPTRKVPEIPPPMQHAQVPVISPPKKVPEIPSVIHPSGPESSRTVSVTVPSISVPPPRTSKKEKEIPVSAPPKDTPDNNHPPRKEHSLNPIASPPTMVLEKPVAVHPSKPANPPANNLRDHEAPVSAPPKGTFHHFSPGNNLPIKEPDVSPISSHPPRISRAVHGKPIMPPPKEAFHRSPSSHSTTKGHSPVMSRSPPTATKASHIVPTPSMLSPKHEKKKWAPSPASLPAAPFYKHHHAKKKVATPGLAPLHSDVSPTSHDQDRVIPLAPLHPPTLAPKKSRIRHHHPPPLLPGLISPIQPPLPSTVTSGSPAPSPTTTISSARGKEPVLHPQISPPRKPKRSPPPPVQVLPPPPPNQDCLSLTCYEPYTNIPPGAPCGCVIPIKVELRLGVALYTFFPLVRDLAVDIANGVFMKQSQVRIMGANAATQQLEKTDVLIDLVPLGETFDNTTAFLTYQRFWNKQVAIKTSSFGDYEVLSVSYPGLPPSPPSAASSITIIGGVPYTNPENNARTMHPLGVDVSRKKKGGLSGSIIAIIVLSSFAAMTLFIGAAWLLLTKVRDHRDAVAKTPRNSIPSLAKQSGAAGSTMFGSGLSSASLSFGSSITAYTGTAKTFSADEIVRATDNFNDSRILGEGGFGRVYKGFLDDGKEVAVKVLKRDDQQGGREFLAEVEMLSRLHHRNLVKLIGICVEDHSRSLIYELIPNGSVESHLHGDDKEAAPLDWGARMKIALGAARGLAYLHEDSSPHVIHRDFKSSNILLDNDFTPKVSDFGLARSALEEGSKHISTRVMGTFGYVAPEYAMTGHLLVKSDVYSYGVVLLELLSGRKPVDMSQPEGQENLVAWARPLLTSKEGLEIMIDPAIRSSISFDNVAKVAAIASMCVQPEVSHRPFMGEVVQALKLVSTESDETKVGSESCSQEYSSVVDIDTKTNTGSGHLLGASHSRYSDYDSSPENDGGLSASDIFTTSRFGRQFSGSFRRHSSSGPLRPGRSRQFWQRVRGYSRGSISEHGFAYRLWGESH